ncbi:paraquat-inducible protein A [Pelagicoccus sp. NFK12]|uniref:Paraquat-inducible protein A n=1 Tax=Pelagicoccus enzymogenes TaxID=2773457 RepID=A0A927IIS0_9BACT|nr:paraquat-inducible protein A [Pelagicoccus enzymogenes]MBD5781124.1 paraquat-inducible protein A [Pelagicoccus enzymogenes]
MAAFLKQLVRNRLISSLLCVSLLCNVAALALPFMRLRKGLDNEAYTLMHSVELLWEKGLYILSLLVIAFSILFPFAKLGTLFWVIGSEPTRSRHLHWLHQVERLGKWSMLDVFLVSIILSLASKQFLVGAQPQPGLTFFIAAILMSMTAGELISRKVNSHSPAKTGTERRQGGIFLALSGITLVAALAFPFLRIEDWLLKNREYSILTLIPALWAQGAWLASLITACFLVATPLLVWFAGLIAWRSQAHNPIPSYWTQLAQRWSMLDVFGLALVVFALESDHIMRTEINWGALFLGATLVLQMLFSFALEKRLFSKSEE